MNTTLLLLFFLVGFFCGVGVLITLYFFFFKKNKRNLNEENDIVSLKQHMQSIQQSLQNFNLAQDRLENTLVRGGSQQQGSWGEFVLKNILDGVGLREGYEYETQKAFRDEEGNLQKPDVIVHMPGKRDIVIDSKVSLSSATKASFSVVASDLSVSPSKVTSALGIGTEPNLLLTVPNNSLHNASPYFLIHCLPTSLIN